MVTKKPKPPVPGRPKPTPAKKKPAQKRVPVTSVTPRSTVKKPSAKQIAGTRKVVGALAGLAIPAGKAVSVARKAKKLDEFDYPGATKYAKKVVKQQVKSGKVVNNPQAIKGAIADAKGDFNKKAYWEYLGRTEPKAAPFKSTGIKKVQGKVENAWRKTTGTKPYKITGPKPYKNKKK